MGVDGKFKLKEDVNRAFARQCLEKLNEPLEIPDSP